MLTEWIISKNILTRVNFRKLFIFLPTAMLAVLFSMIPLAACNINYIIVINVLVNISIGTMSAIDMPVPSEVSLKKHH